MRQPGKKWLIILTILLMVVLIFGLIHTVWKTPFLDLTTQLERESNPVSVYLRWDRLEMGYPNTPITDTILHYTGFDIGYNEKYEQPSWVVYVLTREEVLSGKVNRKDNFRPDTSLRTGSADLSDYRGSGYDRGHLAPAADMKWSERAMDESFLLSNMSPQDPAFNRGIWRLLEEKVREWALEEDSIFVITGPVLDHITKFIGPNEVGVPDSYFKVLVDLSPPDFSMVAFLIPNHGSEGDLSRFMLTVDSLEKLTGYDFFAFAPDQEMVDLLEAQVLSDKWN
jgi:endonuclease G